MKKYVAEKNELFKKVDNKFKKIVTFQFKEDCIAVAFSLNSRANKKLKKDLQQKELQLTKI